MGQVSTQRPGQQEMVGLTGPPGQPEGVVQAGFAFGPARDSERTSAATKDIAEAEGKNSNPPDSEESLEDDPFAEF